MNARTEDAPLATLMMPILDGRLPWPEDGALFLRARYGSVLQERPLPALICEQTFKPDADALQRAGFTTTPLHDGRNFSLVLALPPRQRSEARALLARAVTSLKPGGRVIASASNNDGARSCEADLEQLAGPLETMTKNKCRVFWTSPLQQPVNTELAAQWKMLDAAQPIENGRFLSRPGLFAWDRIDVASALLAANLTSDLKGSAADLGAGFGYLSAELLDRCPGITSLHLYEAEARALDLAKQNLASVSSRVSLDYRWHDVTAGLPESYDVIISNPPFHSGSRNERPDIGKRFITVAAEALRPGGRLWLVANRHLPYEFVLTEHFGRVRTVKQQHGYKIIEAIKASGSKR